MLPPGEHNEKKIDNICGAFGYTRVSLQLQLRASVDELFQSVDDKLFEKIVCNSVHVLQPLIPDRPPSSYDLRLRSHDKLLLNKTSYLNDREFIIRMLYKDSY